VESSQCEKLTENEPAHRYQNLTYHLCRDATKSTTEGWTVCNNVSGKEGQVDADIGSRRLTPCYVCTELNRAEQAYQHASTNANIDFEMASRAATAEYTRAMREAEAVKENIMENSTNQIRYKVSGCSFSKTESISYLLTGIATLLISTHRKLGLA
jgi:hypothetical protein